MRRKMPGELKKRLRGNRSQLKWGFHDREHKGLKGGG